MESKKTEISEDIVQAMEDEERRKLLGDKFANLSTKERLDVVEGSLKKVGSSMSFYRREKLKKWIKKMRRQMKKTEVLVKSV